MLVYSYAPAVSGAPTRLWTFDLRTSAARPLFEDPDGTHVYLYPKLNPFAPEVAFLQLYRTERGLLTRLMLIGLDAPTPKTLLDSSDGVGALCFSPDGQRMGLLTKRGIEALSMHTGERELIVPRSRFEGRTYYGGGMSWSQSGQVITVALLSPLNGSTEIWEFRLDGQEARLLYSSKGRIVALSFIGE